LLVLLIVTVIVFLISPKALSTNQLDFIPSVPVKFNSRRALQQSWSNASLQHDFTMGNNEGI